MCENPHFSNREDFGASGRSDALASSALKYRLDIRAKHSPTE
jgi:hypothetical protein